MYTDSDTEHVSIREAGNHLEIEDEKSEAARTRKELSISDTEFSWYARLHVSRFYA
jgi:hypothetical protein